MCALETPVKMATAFLRLHQHTSVSARRGGLELIVTYVSGSLFYKVQRAMHTFDVISVAIGIGKDAQKVN